MKKILILNRSFWPDNEATGNLFTELAEALTEEYRVVVLAGRSYYVKQAPFKGLSLFSREKYKGIEIIRLRHTVFWKGRLLGRFANWLTYTTLAWVMALGVRADLLIVGTDPPFLGLVAAFLKTVFKRPFLYNCQDLYPDVAIELGQLKANFLSRSFDAMNKRAFLKSAKVVALGESMKKRIAAKGIPEDHIAVIPNWADTSLIHPLPQEENFFLQSSGLLGKFVLMHCGNIGLSQGLITIIEAAELLKENRDICFVFVGDGSAKPQLEKEAINRGLANVFFFPYQPYEKLNFPLNAASLHIVALIKGMEGAIVPSKLYGILAAGRPFIALTDKDAEPALVALQEACGRHVQPADARALADALRWAVGHPLELEAMGKKSREVALKHYARSVVIARWKDEIKKIAG